MPTPVANLIKLHGSHGWDKQPTDHIKNVELVKTHLLMKCPCGWYGWVKSTAFIKHVPSPEEN